MYLNKKEACEILGIGERALGKLVSKGKLSVKYIKGNHGKVAQYLLDEVLKLKETREQPLIRPTVGEPSNTPEHPRTAPAIIENSSAISAQETIIVALQNVSASIINELNLSNKLVLTVSDVKTLTGFSKNFIMEEIKQGNLKARKIGRSWRIKRSDLDKYIEDL